jgi:hypothetical protein
MTASTNELYARIAKLPDADLFEGARYYLASLLRVTSAEEIEEGIQNEVDAGGGDISKLEEIRQSLTQDTAACHELLRFLLAVGADGGDEDRQSVEQALDGTGQKQVVVEIALVLSLGTLASLYLLHLTGGKKRQTRKVKIEKLPDGTVRLQVEETVVYANQASTLGRYLDWLKQLVGAQATDS